VTVLQMFACNSNISCLASRFLLSVPDFQAVNNNVVFT